MSRVRMGLSSLCAAIAICAFSMPALSDQIDPASYTTTLGVGGSASITKTVTITQMSTAPVDVFFLMDTTGSMGATLTDVKTGFASIVSSVSGVSSNTYFGVGNYNDCVNGPGDCPAGTLGLAYTQNQDLTGDTTAVQTALNGLFASGGGDGPESDIYGLDQAALTSSWRPDSRRFLFWAGDIYGHDPRQGVTEADATAALVANKVTTYALNVGAGQLDATGQATRITNATGGAVLSGGYSEATDLILAALTGSLTNYSQVSLDLVGLGPGLNVSFSPPDYTGTYDRSIDRAFAFNVMLTGVTPGTYDFEIVARVDGTIVARETDSITVGGTGAVPEPATYALTGTALLGLYALRRRFA